MGNYIILGVIQGIFEWLPISSQGIVAIASLFLVEYFKPIDIALFIHLGTVFATLIYFRREWQRVLLLKDLELLRFLVIATMVSGIIGLPLYYFIRNMAVGSSLLVITGIGLLFTAYFQKKGQKLALGSNKLGVVVGLLQGFSVIPGFSRSGATIFGLSLGKSDPTEILKTSYMLSVPITLIMTFYLFLKTPNLVFQAWPSLVSSFLVGIITLSFLIKFSKKIDFFKFAIIFAIICFVGAGIGLLF